MITLVNKGSQIIYACGHPNHVVLEGMTHYTVIYRDNLDHIIFPPARYAIKAKAPEKALEVFRQAYANGNPRRQVIVIKITDDPTA